MNEGWDLITKDGWDGISSEGYGLGTQEGNGYFIEGHGIAIDINPISI